MALTVSTKQTIWEAGHEVVSLVTGTGNEVVNIIQSGDSMNIISLSRAQFLMLCELFDKACS